MIREKYGLISIMQKEIEQAVEVFKQGGIVIFPTDTAYGIGCRIDDKNAVARLFTIRKRSESKATPVLVNTVEMAQEYLVDISKDIREKLIEKYWPGALTIVLPCKTEKILDLVRGGGGTLGVRMPDHPVILEIIKKVGVPIIGSSANFAGENTPYRFNDVDPELIKLADYVIEGECSAGRHSTVIDCSISPWKVLREGFVKVSVD